LPKTRDPFGGWLPLSFIEELLVIPWRSAYGENIMSITQIRQLPLAEKLQIMEAIWEDLRGQAEKVPVPNWHQKLLDERRKAVEEGREEVFDWDSIKDTLGPRRKS
jgi:putative addiction module component (TIGR02574 family)